MNGTTILGFVAAFLTTVAFLPQTLKVLRTRSTTDISLLTFSTLCIGILFWLAYGYLTNDLPLLVGNGITLVLAGIILFCKLKYK